MSVGGQGDHEERTLVQLIVEGHSDRYVAARLLVSERTLYRLLERLMLRYDLPNRAALGAFAASRGWLLNYPPPDPREAHAREDDAPDEDDPARA